MFPTVELRWFHKGKAPPEAVRQWFQTLGRSEIQDLRVDHYLRLADEQALGVKFRDGRLEIKRRAAQYGLVQISTRVSGLLEGWRKWSFTLAQPGAAPSSDGHDASPWLPVRKQRRLLRLATVGDRHILFPGQFRPERGCEIELTSVAVGTAAWWSLGFEAYGPASSTKNDLIAVARRFLKGESAPALKTANSYGYPEWLLRLSVPEGEARQG
jgi:hypothetical protein